MSFIQQDNRPNQKNIQIVPQDKVQKDRDLKGGKGDMSRMKSDLHDDDHDEYLLPH